MRSYTVPHLVILCRKMHIACETIQEWDMLTLFLCTRHTHAHTRPTYTHAHTHAHTHTHTHVRTRTHTYTSLRAHTHARVRTHTLPYHLMCVFSFLPNVDSEAPLTTRCQGGAYTCTYPPCQCMYNVSLLEGTARAEDPTYY